MVDSLEIPSTRTEGGMAGRQTPSSSKKLGAFPEDQLCCVSCLSTGAQVTVLEQLRWSSTMQRGKQKKQKTGTKFWGRVNAGLYCLIPFFRQVNSKLLLMKCCLFGLQYLKDLWRLIIRDCTSRVLMGPLSISPAPGVDIFTFFSFKVSKIIKYKIPICFAELKE